MGTSPADLLQFAAVEGQIRRVSVPAFQRLVRDGQNFIVLIGTSGVDLHQKGGELGHHVLILGHPGVLVPLPGGILDEVHQGNAHLVLQLHGGKERLGALSQMPFQRLDAGEKSFGPLQGGLPRLVRGEEVLDGPGIGRLLFASFHFIPSFP